MTKLDIPMQYYTFELDEESQKLCTIVTPFGAYSYNWVPMGLKISPWYAQARMEEVLRGLEAVECYIDDMLSFISQRNAYHQFGFTTIFLVCTSRSALVASGTYRDEHRGTGFTINDVVVRNRTQRA